MKNKRYIFWVFTVTAILFVMSSLSFAQDIKERFKARLPKILELKSKGIIGENNMGYLEYVGSAKPMKDVVDAENNDRRKVYEEIAQKQATTVQKVGQRRALQLRDMANPGEWVQDSTGKWYKK